MPRATALPFASVMTRVPLRVRARSGVSTTSSHDVRIGRSAVALGEVPQGVVDDVISTDDRTISTSRCCTPADVRVERLGDLPA